MTLNTKQLFFFFFNSLELCSFLFAAHVPIFCRAAFSVVLLRREEKKKKRRQGTSYGEGNWKISFSCFCHGQKIILGNLFSWATRAELRYWLPETLSSVFPCLVLPETFWFLLPALVRWQRLVLCSEQGAALSSHIFSSDSLKKKVSLIVLDAKGEWRGKAACFSALASRKTEQSFHVFFSISESSKGYVTLDTFRHIWQLSFGCFTLGWCDIDSGSRRRLLSSEFSRTYVFFLLFLLACLFVFFRKCNSKAFIRIFFFSVKASLVFFLWHNGAVLVSTFNYDGATDLFIQVEWQLTIWIFCEDILKVNKSEIPNVRDWLQPESQHFLHVIQ